MPISTDNILVNDFKSLKTLLLKYGVLGISNPSPLFPNMIASLQLVRVLYCAPSIFQVWWVYSVVKVSVCCRTGTQVYRIRSAVVNFRSLSECKHRRVLPAGPLHNTGKGPLPFAEKSDLKKVKYDGMKPTPLELYR